jgi:hypothetical protein
MATVPNIVSFPILLIFRYYQPLKEVVLIEEKKLFGFFDGQQDERHVTETGMQALSDFKSAQV